MTKLTIVEIPTDKSKPYQARSNLFEVVKVENSIRWSIGELIGARELNADLGAGRIKTVLIKKK